MNKKNISTKALSGFMELLPEEQILFNDMLDVIRKTYELFGFIPMDTPVLERADTLLAKVGGETEKQIYKFSRGNTELAMRFDLTVPLSRYVSEHYADITFPYKRYAVGKVFRGERAQSGRFREFYQCDIDVVGDGVLDLQFDAEIPSVIYTIFKKLGFNEFTISINNRKIFNGLFEKMNITNLSTDIMRSIDKLDKIGLEKVKNEIAELNISKADIDYIFDVIMLDGEVSKVLQSLRKLNIDNNTFEEGVNELHDVVSALENFGVPETNFKVDLKIARGLDYYTGTVYETQLDKYPEFGSVCSGGRYDDLANVYTKHKLPGVGISIGLTRLFDQLYKNRLIHTSVYTKTKVLVIPMVAENITECISLATYLRENDISTEIAYNQGKLKQKLNYANKKGIPFVIFVGDDEIKTGLYTLKNFIDGTQEKVDKSDIAKKVKNV